MGTYPCAGLSTQYLLDHDFRSIPRFHVTLNDTCTWCKCRCSEASLLLKSEFLRFATKKQGLRPPDLCREFRELTRILNQFAQICEIRGGGFVSCTLNGARLRHGLTQNDCESSEDIKSKLAQAPVLFQVCQQQIQRTD